ncbi:outer membrane beta-barrel protein [Foetidibacter luteolus]|uniref:outer membrane beta-barrel protein n=1 Tax=Foetidibacter luteolus TaxID=2608880 RepID=UPI00129A1F54|nr:outer membrane beta-barrel protein [Foetidibacter luteolus]
MQQLNDDMDELFRKAADNYPLNTQGADWDKVMHAMNEQPDAPDEAITDKKGNNYRRLLWLLLLLPVIWICNRFTGGTDNAVAPNETVAAKAKDTGETAANTTVQENEAGVNKTQPQPDEKPGATVTPPEGVDAGTGTNASQPRADKTFTANSTKQTTVKANRQNTIAKDNVTKSPAGIVAEEETRAGVINAEKKTGPAVEQPTNTLKPQNDTPAADVTATTLANQIADTGKLSSATSDSTATKDSTALTTPVIAKKKPGKPAAGNHFYVGLFTGPDVSTVKAQRMSLGYGTGVMLGYRFAGRWAVETGLFWDYKKYHTEGKHVNTEKLDLPYHSMVINADGVCYMFEIPVNVNYYFGKKTGYNWFVSAGSSSYIMNKEDYSYLYERYNNQYSGSRNYYTSSSDWFSMLNLSAGFEKQIGKSGKLRLQPYLRIPLRGVGIAQLPISSSGFYIGYTKKLF